MSQPGKLKEPPKLEEYLSYFGDGTDRLYLEVHYPRFRYTKIKAAQRWHWDNAHVLDVGAHWLHQSLLYALDGCRVTAADFPVVLDEPAVRDVSERHDIRLYPYTDLSSESVFDGLEDDSVDVVLFCEIIEHITFNPVDMWKAIYRVLRPAGRIIITTPNFYRLDALLPMMWRFLVGRGGGITVEEILGTPTYGPHWKEFSKRELKRYFTQLSPDFQIGRALSVSQFLDTEHLNWKGMLRFAPGQLLPLTRHDLYFEIDLPAKEQGISISPNWWHGANETLPSSQSGEDGGNR